MILQRDVTPQAFVWLLGAASQLHRIPFDPRLVLQQFPPPHTVASLQAALEGLGFRSALEPRSPEAFTDLAFPCFALVESPQDQTTPDTTSPDVSATGLETGDPSQPPVPPAPFLRLGAPGLTAVPAGPESETPPESIEPPQPPLTFVLLLKAEAGRVTYLIPGEQSPRDDDIATFATTYVGAVLQFARQEAPLTDPDQADKGSRFGFRWFLPELLKHKTIWRDVLLASLAIQLVGLATPLFTQVIIDKVVVHQTQSTLVVIGIALIMFMLFTATMTWLRQYLVLHTGNRIDAVLGSQVFRHLLRLPLPYFEHRPTGTLVARLHGVETIREFVSSAAVTLILDFPFLLIFLAVMFWYSWQLSLIAVGLLGLIALMSLLVAPLFRERLNQQFLLGARNQSFLTDNTPFLGVLRRRLISAQPMLCRSQDVSGMATVKSLQMEPHVEKRYGDYLASYLAAGFSTKQVGNTYNIIANGIEQVMTLSILIVGALLVMKNDAPKETPLGGGFTVGMLVAFQMFAGRMSQPMLRLVGLWQEFQQANIAVKRLGDILDMPTEPHTLTPAREASGRGLIEMEAVAFRYDRRESPWDSEHHPWLYRNLSLAFKPGRLTVLMGPSGCGKSTLAKLLQGFYLPQEGQIRLDGRDIRHLAANELRTTFGVVPQETVLFSGTLYDNLVMAQPHAGFEDVIRACKAAEIHEVIDQLPQGYQTEIGERGVGLSGGQRQRLAIARALLKRPKVLVFDEAVSNLDQQTAEHFARTINTLKGKVTMIFITHQIPRGLQVDEVITLGEHATKMSVAGEQEG